MPKPKTPPPGASPASVRESVRSAAHRLNTLRDLMAAYDTATGYTPLRDLNSVVDVATAVDFLSTLIDDLKAV